MFEKKAEEYVIKKHNIDMSKQPVDFTLKCEFSEDLTDFQKGAEFGYNFAHEEMDYLNKHWRNEKDKANEWHYVKDEKDLPTDKTEYLLLLGSGIRTFGFYNGRFWESWKGDFSWQEVKAYFFIPVPELPKESE